MAWAPLLLVLTALCSCSVAQFSLAQEPSMSVSPGQTVKLTCTRNVGGMSSYYVSWYQQRPGTVPKLVMHTWSSRPSDVPPRFTGSYETSPNAAYLTISGVLAEDDADYYCLSYDGSNKYIFGGGTQLNVLSGETKVPTLDVFPPSSEEVATNKATMVCLLSNFYPGSVTVTWKADDQTISSGVETTRPAKQTDNNLFMASSYLSVPAADWSTGKKYTCQATHESKIIEKSLKHSECV